MQHLHAYLTLSALLLITATCFQGCTHKPVLPGVDQDAPPTPTTCAPNTVSFERDILPILQASCAYSGCHDAPSAAGGVVLTAYAPAMEVVNQRSQVPDESRLYQVITHQNPASRMPPPPDAGLDSASIARMAQWIRQGARNIRCK